MRLGRGLHVKVRKKKAQKYEEEGIPAVNSVMFLRERGGAGGEDAKGVHYIPVGNYIRVYVLVLTKSTVVGVENAGDRG